MYRDLEDIRAYKWRAQRNLGIVSSEMVYVGAGLELGRETAKEHATRRDAAAGATGGRRLGCSRQRNASLCVEDIRDNKACAQRVFECSRGCKGCM